jgi:hypothetical protein
LDPSSIHIRPEVEIPVIFTSGFNPTAVTRHTTRSGRELVLVLNTGAIGASAGAGNISTDASVDAIDAEGRRVVATIPLGPAGAFNRIVIDPSGRVALMGASSERQLYAIDLEPLEEESLYEADAPPILDGTSEAYPWDARIFTADHPLMIPGLAEGGPDPRVCAGLTDVAINRAGNAAYAVDYCDGTLTVVRMNLGGQPEVPVPRERFSLGGQHPVLAPLVPESIDLLRAPGLVQVRPGVPGVDYTSPDVYFVAGLPEGEVCGVRVDFFAPGP